MSAATFALTIDRRESLRGSLLVSLVSHALLGALALGYTALGMHRGVGWGNPWGAKSSIRVNVVNSLPGMPLPAPKLATPNTLATENPGLYHKEPEPKAEPPKNAKEIPKFQDTAKLSPPERVNKRIQHEIDPPPPNAIPTGESRSSRIPQNSARPSASTSASSTSSTLHRPTPYRPAKVGSHP